MAGRAGAPGRLVSLLDEWEQLRHPDDLEAEAAGTAVAVVGVGAGPLAEPGRVTTNVRAFRVMVRNELFRWVELLARGDLEALVEREGSGAWTPDRLAEATGPYWEEHDAVGIGPEARGPALLTVEEGPEAWTVTQVLDDPAGDHDWVLRTRVRLDASDEEGRAVADLVAVERL